MKVAFTDLWEPFDPSTNFYVDLLQSIGHTVEVVNPEDCEILFYSCYTQDHRKYKPKMKIYVTGENTRPNFDECDYSLTFDFDDYEGRNIRCPLWMLQLDWFDKGGYTNPKFVSPLSHVETNPYPTEKEHFCSIVVNNFFPERKAMFDLMSRYRPIITVGKPWGNWIYGEDEKFNIISKAKFNICFENTKYPGYFTEKPIHARLARTIPIYSADPKYAVDFNPKGFMYIGDFGSPDAFMKRIEEIDLSNDLFLEYINQPIFNTPTYHIDLFNDIKEKVKKIL